MGRGIITEKALKKAVKFLTDAVDEKEFPPEMRRKCAEKIIELANNGSELNSLPAKVEVKFEVVE